jgi:hypothetical protein
MVVFRQGPQQLGWTDGGDLRIDYRWVAGNAENFPKYASGHRESS